MTEISDLSLELIGLILSYLPILNLIKVSTVCKLWHSIISSPSFSNHHINQPWLILHGFNEIYTLDNKTQTFAFDPSSNSWFLLPTIPTPEKNVPTFAFFGNNGFVSIPHPEFLYASIFHPVWHATSPLHSPAVFNEGSKIMVVGGKRHVVMMDSVFDVEIFDPLSNCWELGPSLPEKLRFKYRTSTALFKGKYYVLNRFEGFVSSFDLHQRVWSNVLTLKPPGVMKSFLIASREHLILAGNCILTHDSFIKLWKVDEKTMEFTEISVMPPDLYSSLFDKKSEYALSICVWIVGMGDLLYVLNLNNYKTCVCEISGEFGKSVWRRVPKMPLWMNNFNQVLSFCSTVSMHSILG